MIYLLEATTIIAAFLAISGAAAYGKERRENDRLKGILLAQTIKLEVTRQAFGVECQRKIEAEKEILKLKKRMGEWMPRATANESRTGPGDNDFGPEGFQGTKN